MSFHVGQGQDARLLQSAGDGGAALSNIIKSVAEYGISKPLKLQAPFLVRLELYRMRVITLQALLPKVQAKCQRMSSASTSGSIYVDQLADNDVVAIAFSGGEALLRDDFWKSLVTPQTRDCTVSLATNGTLLTKTGSPAQGRWRRVLSKIQPLIQSILQNTTRFRGVNGAWERTVAGIKNVVAQDGAYSWHRPIRSRMRTNRELDALVAFSRKLGVDRTLDLQLYPVGRGSDIIDMDLPQRRRSTFLQQMYGYLSGQDESFEILTTAPQFSRVCMMNSQNGINLTCALRGSGFQRQGGVTR